jgi:hypothetical protein
LWGCGKSEVRSQKKTTGKADWKRMEAATQPSSRDVKRGVVLVFAMHAIYALLWLAWWVLALKANAPGVDNRPELFMWASIFYVGVTQMIYVLPVIAYYWRKQRPLVVKGLIIAAALTVALNALGLIALVSNM